MTRAHQHLCGVSPRVFSLKNIPKFTRCGIYFPLTYQANFEGLCNTQKKKKNFFKRKIMEILLKNTFGVSREMRGFKD